MTSAEKARETRKRHKEAQRQAAIEAKALHAKMKDSCISILESRSISAEQRLDALKILYDLMKGR